MIVFDTETTNLTKAIDAPLDKQPRIIEYHATKVDDSTLETVDELNLLINPGERITDEITKITSITNEMLSDKPKFSSVARQIAEFHLGERHLCGHNISFDVDMLYFELQRMGISLRFPWPMEHHCTVELSEHYQGRRLKLIDLHTHLTGKGFESAHRAKADVDATLACAREMRAQGDWPF